MGRQEDEEMERSRSAGWQFGKLVGQDVGKKFRLTRGSHSRTEVFSAHWRARLLPSRDFGKSANRQVDNSVDWQLVASELVPDGS